MTDQELEELLDSVEEVEVDFSFCSTKPAIKQKDPSRVFDKQTEFLNDLEAVVYKIDDSKRCYVGRTCSLFHRILSHKTRKSSKAYAIINESNLAYKDLVTVLWRGNYHDSIGKEAYYIEKLSTVGQTKHEASQGKVPVQFPKRIRRNEIP